MNTNLATNNVVGLKTNSAYESIQLFIGMKEDRSENTAKNYLGFYKEFFMYSTNKKINEVTWNDILNITYKDALMYREYLADKGNVNRTINNKIISLRSLWKHFIRDNKQIDETVFEIDALNEITEDTRYGSLTFEEFDALLDFCSKQKQKPDIKRAYFKFAVVTTMRSGAILKLNWKDIKRKIDHKTGKEVWVVTAWHKNKEINKGITDEYYDELCLLKTLTTTKDDYIFNISDKTLAKTLKDFTIEHGIGEDRNIVLHSLKSTSIDKIWNDTKDTLICSIAAGHSNPMTTYNTYIGKNKGFLESASYIMLTEKEGIDKLKELSKDELLDLIGKSKWVIKELMKGM